MKKSTFGFRLTVMERAGSNNAQVSSLAGSRWLRIITPLGGLAFLGGWLCLALVMWRP